MRYTILVLIVLLSACGKDGTNGINGADGSGLQGLPGSTGATGPQGTPGSNGTNGANGSPGSSGLTIVSNKTIQRIGPDPYTGVGTNLCTAYNTDTCSFEGGQLIQYTDGSIYLAGTYRMIRDDTPNSDTFYNESFHAYIFNSAANSGSIVLTSKQYTSVNNPRILFLYWQRSPELVQLVIDTNQNKTVDGGDTVLQTLTVN